MLLAVALEVIGFDRKWLDPPARLRTHMLMALVAALSAVIAPKLHGDAVRGAPRVPNLIRVIEAVTAGGVSYSGAIFRSGRDVKGLTTGPGRGCGPPAQSGHAVRAMASSP